MDPLAIVRAIHFTACTTLLAIPVFAIWTLPPGLLESRAGMVLRARFRFVLIGTAGVAILSGITAFALIAWSLIAETDAGMGALLIHTHIGHLFLLRLVLMAAFLGSVWTDAPRWLLAILAAGVLGSLAWAGHAAACCGSGYRLAVDATHLLAAGVWPGGLLPLALYLAAAHRDGAGSDFSSTGIVVRRFSVRSLLAVAILAAAGVGNASLILGSFRALFTTTYGQMLVAKLLLFSAMIAVATWNLFFLSPRLRSPARESLCQLRRNVWIELAIGIGVLIIVGALGITAPR